VVDQDLMGNSIRVLCLVIITLTTGCSADTAQRTSYETLQNVREQECLKNPSSSDCRRRNTYEDYQRKRKELEPSK
jgi:hypothetical protein